MGEDRVARVAAYGALLLSSKVYVIVGKFYARFGLGDAGGNFRRDPRHRGLQGYSDRRRTRAGAQQSFRQGDDIGKEGREQRRQRVSEIRGRSITATFTLDAQDKDSILKEALWLDE